MKVRMRKRQLCNRHAVIRPIEHGGTYTPWRLPYPDKKTDWLYKIFRI